MKIRLLKLGTIVKDTPTGVKGMLTIASMDMDKNINYIFQPCSLNPTTGQPSDRIQVVENRIKGGEYEEIDLPVQILGTIVEDKATNFRGTAVCLDYHISGCVHFDVKPAGLIKKTGCTIDAYNFDIRRLVGAEIPKLTEEKLEESKKSTPSPEKEFQKSKM